MQAFLDIFDIYLLEAVINGILLGGDAGAARARAQPDLRRHRRDLDLLRRARDDRHVRHVFHGAVLRPQLFHRRAVHHSTRRDPRRSAALPRDRAAADRAADQSAARDGWGAVRAPELCHRRLRHRLSQSRHPPAGARLRRHAFQLRTAAVLSGRAGRHGRSLPLHDAHLHWHRDPRHLAGSADHGADGCRYSTHLPHHLRARRRAGRARRLPAGSAI